MNPVQVKPKTIIYFLTFFLTGLALLHEILKQTGIEKIKELYLKKISASLHTVGLLDKDPEYGLYISGDFANLQEVSIWRTGNLVCPPLAEKGRRAGEQGTSSAPLSPRRADGQQRGIQMQTNREIANLLLFRDKDANSLNFLSL